MNANERLSWRSCARTDVGARRDTNEDALLERPDVGLWAVADGMGGHSAGDVASRAVVESLARLDLSASLSESIGQVEDCLVQTNAYLRELAAARNIHTIGSTVVALRLAGRHGLCMWAGDSRAYRYRQGRLVRITEDHTLVGELLERGIIDAQQAEAHPHGNLVSRAIGSADDLRPDLEVFELQPHDVFVLCSDGLDKEVSENEIAHTIEQGHGPDLSDVLVNLALASGGRDNVTVVTVSVDAPEIEPNDDARHE